ncbi:MAG: NAD(P)H-dependent oxidoreductase subunit E [Bacillota bacterium]
MSSVLAHAEVDWEVLNPQIDEVIEQFKGQPSALIEVMHKLQEMIGFLPRDVQIKIADGLGVAQSEVYSVASFYSHFSFKPKGKHQVCLCMGTACYVKGSPEILEKVGKELGIEPGDTTDDGLFSLESVRCLGACGLGPVMTVNNVAHGLLKPDKAVEILKNCSCKEK